MRFLAGFVFAFIVVALGVFYYFKLGRAPVATDSAPWPYEKQLAHMALNAVVDKDAPKAAPFQPQEADFVAGAHMYREHCAVCHGLKNQPKTAIAKGEYPIPPQLLHGTGVTDDPPGETYWKVANGIRLTGMPAYSKSLSEKQMWQISFVMAQADKLPSAANEILLKPFPEY